MAISHDVHQKCVLVSAIVYPIVRCRDVASVCTLLQRRPELERHMSPSPSRPEGVVTYLGPRSAHKDTISITHIYDL